VSFSLVRFSDEQMPTTIFSIAVILEHTSSSTLNTPICISEYNTSRSILSNREEGWKETETGAKTMMVLNHSFEIRTSDLLVGLLVFRCEVRKEEEESHSPIKVRTEEERRLMCKQKCM
jgi:hypothetical protein